MKKTLARQIISLANKGKRIYRSNELKRQERQDISFVEYVTVFGVVKYGVNLVNQTADDSRTLKRLKAINRKVDRLVVLYKRTSRIYDRNCR